MEAGVVAGPEGCWRWNLLLFGGWVAVRLGGWGWDCRIGSGGSCRFGSLFASAMTLCPGFILAAFIGVIRLLLLFASFGPFSTVVRLYQALIYYLRHCFYPLQEF